MDDLQDHGCTYTTLLHGELDSRLRRGARRAIGSSSLVLLRQRRWVEGLV
jgi:hypothetical protein